MRLRRRYSKISAQILAPRDATRPRGGAANRNSLRSSAASAASALKNQTQRRRERKDSPRTNNTKNSPGLVQPWIPLTLLRCAQLVKAILVSLGGGLTHPAEIPVAEEGDSRDHHERREKELAPGNNEPRWEQQQSNGRNKGGTGEARTAPREDAGDDACAAPHQSEQCY